MKKLVITALASVVAVLVTVPTAMADNDTICGAGTEVFAPANPPPLTPVLGPVTVDNVIVPAGNVCTMVGTQVRGSVYVNPGGTLQSWQSNITGNVSAQSPRYVDLYATRVGGNYLNRDATIDNDICGSTIGGNLELHRSRGNDRIGIGTIVGFCAAVGGPIGNTIGGNIKILGSLGFTTLRGNTVREDLQFFENRGGFIGTNTIGENLQCERNAPPPSGVGNTAAQKEGQCAAF